MPHEAPGEALDADLIGASARGDRVAFGQLVVRHRDAVYRFLLTLTRNEASAEDALQETFMAAWRHAEGYRGSSQSARGWLLTIARHAIYRQHRKHVGEPDKLDSLSELGVAAGWGEDPSPNVAARLEDRDLLQKGLARLVPTDQEVLLLVDAQELDYEEAARVLELSLPALKSRLHRARLRMMAALREEVAHGG